MVVEYFDELFYTALMGFGSFTADMCGEGI